LNEKRFKESYINTLRDIQKTVAFIQEVALRKQLDQGEMESLLSVVRDYAHSWELLDQYDKGDVVVVSSKKKTKPLDYESVRNALDILRDELTKKGEAGDLFSKERDGTFQGILKTIHQMFDGKDVYPSLEEKAANLLYFVIKDHPFFDGNKRSGAFLFVWFLQINKALFRRNGERKINDRALVALALLIAQSDPRDKEQMVALTTQLIK
jgi:prophage maintenance system killer protein